MLERLLDAWQIDRAAIVGHDIGGATAMIFATRNPHRILRLALIDTVSYDSWPSETWRKIIRDHLHEYHRMSLKGFREMMVRQLKMTVHDKGRMEGGALEAYLEPLSGELGKTSFFAHQVSHYDSRYTEEIADDLKELPMPVKILWGEEEEWQPVSYAKRLRDDIPNATLTVVAGAGHFLMEEASERVTTELAGFFGKEKVE